MGLATVFGLTQLQRCDANQKPPKGGFCKVLGQASPAELGVRASAASDRLALAAAPQTRSSAQTYLQAPAARQVPVCVQVIVEAFSAAWLTKV